VVKPKKEGREREREICTQFIKITELRRRLADLREREREREERGKGAFAVGDRFCRYHFFTNQNNRPYYVCRQPNAAKVVVVVVVVVVGPS
jgi:hypothetical protein